MFKIKDLLIFSIKSAHFLYKNIINFHQNFKSILNLKIFSFEMITENNWQLRTFACWQLDLLRRSPQLSDNTTQTHISHLSTIHENLTKLLCMLVSQSFVVAIQPDPVLKTQHKFVSEVRLLIGDRLGIKQHLVNANVTVKIIAEEEARQLSVNQVAEKDM